MHPTILSERGLVCRQAGLGGLLGLERLQLLIKKSI